MRTRFVLLAAVALAACASTPAPQSAGPAPTTTTAPRGNSAIENLLRSAGDRDAATLQAAERALGAADVRREDGAGAALTYRLETCGLLLLFRADARNTMRLAEAHPSARRAGEAAPSLELCAAEAGARRS